MVQRSSTHIVRSATLMEIGAERPVLRAGGRRRGHHRAGRHDLRVAAVPGPARVPDSALRRRCASATRTSMTGLRRPGSGTTGARTAPGLFMKYLRRGSGYYIDVGAARSRGRRPCEARPGQVDHLAEDAVVLDDGTELQADLVVYATGYGSMNGWAARPDLPGGRRSRRQGLGSGLGHREGPGPVGGGGAQHVEAHPAARRCGSTAATCTSRATTRCTWRCSSRRGSSASTRPCTGCRWSTTSVEAGGRDGSRGHEFVFGYGSLATLPVARRRRGRGRRRLRAATCAAIAGSGAWRWTTGATCRLQALHRRGRSSARRCSSASWTSWPIPGRGQRPVRARRRARLAALDARERNYEREDVSRRRRRRRRAGVGVRRQARGAAADALGGRKPVAR